MEGCLSVVYVLLPSSLLLSSCICLSLSSLSRILPPLRLPTSPRVSRPPPSISTRPWDPLNDLIQFEKDGCIQTKVRHRTPMVRSGSLISLSNQGPRRDNCKCQVGRPDRKPPFKTKTKKSSSPPQPPSTQHPMHRLHCRFFSLCRTSPLSPLLLSLCLLFFFFFVSYPGTGCSLCMGGQSAR